MNLGLSGWTSMHDLCIQQGDVPPYAGAYLRLSPDQCGTVTFEFFDTAIDARRWRRTIEAEQTVDRFARFLDELHWA